MYKKMLVPLDGSPISEIVFPYVHDLASRMKLEITLLLVQRREDNAKAHLYKAYLTNKVDILKCQSEGVKGEGANKKACVPIKVNGEIIIGSPAEEIMSYAEENDMDFILIATHGSSGIKQLVMGSVAEKVVRASNIPVWLVRPGISRDIPFDKWPKRNLLVLLDGSEMAEAVLPHVQTLSSQYGVNALNVVLLRVYEPLYKSGYYIPETPLTVKTINEYLAGVEKRLKDAGLGVWSEARKGKPLEEIEKYIKDNPFTITAMSLRGQAEVPPGALSKVTEKLLREAVCPFFLVNPQ